LTIPWTPPSPYRKREIIQGLADGKTSARPMRANAGAILLDALRNAHRWLEELLCDPSQTPERYYVSQAALQGDKSKSGSIVRVPAPQC
jgi:hypothetical protein